MLRFNATFKDPKSGTACSGIFRNLLCRGSNALDQNLSQRFLSANADGEIGRAGTGALVAGKGAFYNAILQAVEGKNGDASAVVHGFDQMIQSNANLLQLVVNGNADGLKDPFCGVLLFLRTLSIRRAIWIAKKAKCKG